MVGLQGGVETDSYLIRTYLNVVHMIVQTEEDLN